MARKWFIAPSFVAVVTGACLPLGGRQEVGNGKQGIGAAFPFDAGLRGSESRVTGALSDLSETRFKLVDSVKTPCTHFLVVGTVDEQ